MNLTISSALIPAIVATMAAGVIIPVLLVFILKKKTGGKLIPFWLGCATMFVSAMVLESILHSIVLASPVGPAIQNNIWLYGLYGALAAATFEEVGRYITMHFLLKKYHGDKTASLMYGAGHAGFECFFLLVSTMASNLVIAIMIQSGTTDLLFNGIPEAQIAAVNDQIAAVAAIQPIMLTVSVLERLIAIAGQIAMSVVMWQAAANGKKIYFLYTFLFHFAMDFTIVLVNNYLGTIAAEITIFIFAVLFGIFAASIYKKEKASEAA